MYDQHSVKRVAVIKCAQQTGFTLKEMQALMQHGPTAPRERLHHAIVAKQVQLQARIDALQQFDGLRAFETSLDQLPASCYPL